MTVRDAAEGVGVRVDTAFRSRHRFLQAAVACQPRGVSGVLQVGETCLPDSKKGQRCPGRKGKKRGGEGSGRRRGDWVPVLVGRGRGLPATNDRVREAMNGEAVTDALRQVVAPGGQTLVCTDGHSAFLRLQSAPGVATRTFVASCHGHVRNRAHHVQTANQYHGTLRGWIPVALRGAATKYLPRHLGWMRLMSWAGRGARPREIVASALGRQVINR
ncbi:IS1595 family transposase [Sediminicurvatus halobius]|uniref:IS1595 family transposase n=1 Tax=Sediminicurvatus halobius TaxID=2182432 RepID=A0A2U2MXV0_9GAMM|nr:IS1595 family transposase [Spiribacter halobius]PWG61603.1 IS1595 family transposase [Spiribacter halobius]UEX77280.1 IS1595 family transposase [Spiribacter halobius]